MNKINKIELAIYTDDPFNETFIIRDVMSHIMCEITSNAWNNRPEYDEDAGVFVSTEKYSPLKFAFNFAFLDMADRIVNQMRLSIEEEISISKQMKNGEKNITIVRELTDMEIATIIQAIYYYLQNIEDDYKRKETDLYESDNHYTGKPLQHFIDAAIERANEDKEKYRAFAKKLGRKTQ